MKRSKFLEWIGYKFIANHRTKEVHIASKMTDRCRLIFMRNAEYVSEKRVKKLYESGYNGCRFCNKENDKG